MEWTKVYREEADAQKLSGLPTAYIKKHNKTYYLTVSFPEQRLNIYPEHLDIIKKSIADYESFLKERNVK